MKKEVPIMPDMTNAITNTISISLFNRGLAGKVFEDVKRSGAKVVMSPDEYVRLMDEINDARLLALATERMSNYDASRVISEAEVLKELGITADDLADADKVEIE